EAGRAACCGWESGRDRIHSPGHSGRNLVLLLRPGREPLPYVRAGPLFGAGEDADLCGEREGMAVQIVEELAVDGVVAFGRAGPRTAEPVTRLPHRLEGPPGVAEVLGGGVDVEEAALARTQVALHVEA